MELYFNAGADVHAVYAVGGILTRDATAEALNLLNACPRHKMTPLRRLDLGAAAPGCDILYKDEAGRLGLGSFKALGGAYAVLRIIQDAAGPQAALGSPAWRQIAGAFTFVCATDGNHGRAVAAGARLAGARAVIYVHEGVAAHRVEIIQRLGAEVRVASGHYDDAVAAAGSAARANGWVAASDTSYPGCEQFPRLVLQGYSILADEAIGQAGAFAACPYTHVFVQAGVGGLAAAIAAHFWERYGNRRPKIVVVEPERADCLFQSARAGATARSSGDLETGLTMLACGEPSHDAWTILKTAGDAFMTISDAEAMAAVAVLSRDPQFGGRPPTSLSGAAGLAGLLAARASLTATDALGLEGARILVIGSEGPNDTPASLAASELQVSVS